MAKLANLICLGVLFSISTNLSISKAQVPPNPKTGDNRAKFFSTTDDLAKFYFEMGDVYLVDCHVNSVIYYIAKGCLYKSIEMVSRSDYIPQ